jgi:hypothetical protein
MGAYSMDANRPVSPAPDRPGLEMLLPAMAETMKFAMQALAQASALSEVLIAKGILTKAELVARMSSDQELRDKLTAKLDEQIHKQS